MGTIAQDGVTESQESQLATGDRGRPLFRPRGGTLVGMLHLPPLPGSAIHDGTTLQTIERRAVAEAEALAEAGFDALVLQNTGDGPPGKDGDAATVAQMAVIGRAIRESIAFPVGVNVLKNGVETAFAIASACGAEFVRIKVYVGAVVGSEGIVEGGAAAALRERRRLGLEHVAIVADVHDRTSRPIVAMPVVEAADWAVRHGHADALAVTGHSVDETLTMLRDLRAAEITAPLIVGGGGTAANVADLLRLADGVIVGTALKDVPYFAAPVSIERARQFVAAAREAHDIQP